jgi:hypothetical protein
VKNNDPATSTFVLVPLSASGSEAQGQDLLTLAAVLADANFTEATGSTWARAVLADADLAAFPGPDTGADEYVVAVPSYTWTPGPAAGNDTTGLLVCYDANSGADAAIVPLTHHDFAVTTDGNDVVLNAGDFFSAA